MDENVANISFLALSKGRFPYDFDFSKRSHQRKKMKYWRLDQYIFIYGVHHWCRDEHGRPLDEKTNLHIILNHYNLNEEDLTKNDEKFLCGGSKLLADLTEKTASYAESERDFFEPKVMEAWRRYKGGMRGPP